MIIAQRNIWAFQLDKYKISVFGNVLYAIARYIRPYYNDIGLYKAITKIKAPWNELVRYLYRTVY